jgi:hypothetical protein
MTRTAVALMLLVACAGCGRDDAATPAATTAVPSATPTPPPAPPATGADADRARAAALAAGPGTCDEDVPAIRVLPMKGELGVDAHYDRLAVHPQAYKACLVAMVRDRTAIADPGQGPARTPYVLGDLAYDLLARLGHIKYGDCIPAEVMKKTQASGSVVVYQWLDAINHRRQVHRCLGKRLGV